MADEMQQDPQSWSQGVLAARDRTARVLEAVALERRAQDAKWGSSTVAARPIERGLTVLTEEVGEVARALLDCEGRDALRREVVQAAAVAVAMVEAIDNGCPLAADTPFVLLPPLALDPPHSPRGSGAVQREPAAAIARAVTTHYPRCREMAVDGIQCTLGVGHEGTHTPFPVSDWRGHLAPHEVEAIALDGGRLAEAIDNACRVLVAAPDSLPQRFHMEVEAFAGNLLRTQLAPAMRAVAAHDQLFLRLGLVSQAPVRADAPAPAATTVTFHPKQSAVSASFEERNPGLRAFAAADDALAAGLGVRPDTLERDLEAVDLNPPKGTIVMKPPRCEHRFLSLYRRVELDGSLSEWEPRCADCSEVIGELVYGGFPGEYFVKIPVTREGGTS